MTSCGRIVLPSDFDIFRPSSSTTKPWVSDLPERRRGRACRGRRAASSGTSRGAGRCLRGRGRPARSARAGTAAPPRGWSPSRTTRRGCRARARTRCRRRPGTRGRRARTRRSAARTTRRRRARRTPRPRARRAPASAAPRRTSRSRAPESAHPRRAGARCTSRGGSRACSTAGRVPTPGSTRPRGRRLRARAARSVRVGTAEHAVHPDEPLRRREEDHRVVAAPAVRVRVLERLAVPQARRAPRAPLDVTGFASNTRCPPNSSTVSRKWPPGPTGA